MRGDILSHPTLSDPVLPVHDDNTTTAERCEALKTEVQSLMDESINDAPMKKLALTNGQSFNPLYPIVLRKETISVSFG